MSVSTLNTRLFLDLCHQITTNSLSTTDCCAFKGHHLQRSLSMYICTDRFNIVNFQAYCTGYNFTLLAQGCQLSNLNAIRILIWPFFNFYWPEENERSIQTAVLFKWPTDLTYQVENYSSPLITLISNNSSYSVQLTVAFKGLQYASVKTLDCFHHVSLHNLQLWDFQIATNYKPIQFLIIAAYRFNCCKITANFYFEYFHPRFGRLLGRLCIGKAGNPVLAICKKSASGQKNYMNYCS